MNRFLKRSLIALSTVIGISALVLYTTLVREVLFKNSSFCTSTWLQMASLELSLFGSALVAGFISSIVVIRQSSIPHIFLSVYVLVQFSMAVGCVQNLWFESSTFIMVVSGIWMGRYSANKFPLAPF